MSYQVIARKYRPQRFADVVGQEHVTQTLSNAIASGRIAHAYLFSGPRGTGKTTIARIFAKCLNATDGPAVDFKEDDERCVEITEGRALDVMGTLTPSFDMVFLDANKDGYPAYLKQAVRLTRPGGLIVADNVVREGAVMNPSSVDANAIGAAAFNQALAGHPRLEAIVLQQVGIKGHDGLAVARVKDD